MISKLIIPKYIFGGLINTLFSYIIFVLIFTATESVLVSLCFVSIVGTTFSFIYNKRIVFMKSHKGSLLKFIFLQLIIIVTNWVVLHVVSINGFSRIQAQMFFSGFFALFNYFLASRFIFINTISKQ